MLDVSAIILSKILLDKDLETFSKIKLSYLDPIYTGLYTSLQNYYNKYGNVPSFEELEVSSRDRNTLKLLSTLKNTSIPDVPTDVVFDALVDRYIQGETIKELEDFIPKIPVYDSNEIRDLLSSIALKIEDRCLSSENLVTMLDIPVFEPPELIKEAHYLGLNNDFDSYTGGALEGELILIGGKRGSGKSITCSNIFVNQYISGNVSMYFSIEMSAYEIHNRHLAMLSGVDFLNIRKKSLSIEEINALAKVRCNMFDNGDTAYSAFLEHRDTLKLEKVLQADYSLKNNNQMIIIDDRDLSIQSIDLFIGKMKSRFEDKLNVISIDYLNQVIVQNNQDPYDWKIQIEIAKKLKNLARKWGVIIVSPYQIDSSGEARFSKGILDSADIALIIDKKEDHYKFQTSKVRNAGAFEFLAPFNPSTLRIKPSNYEIPIVNKNEDSEETPWETI